MADFKKKPERIALKDFLSYHCPFEIRLCSGKGGHGRLGRVDTGLLSRALPIGPKGADLSPQERRAVPLF